MLAELSVVDNPMNPLALFDGVAKGMLIKRDTTDGLVAGEALVEEKGLFYCGDCDIAKLESLELESVECITCDASMEKIGEVEEAPSSDDLIKMVQAHWGELNKSEHSGEIEMEDETETEEEAEMTPSDGESGFGHSGEWKPDPAIENPETEQVSMPEGTPQTESPAPHAC